MGINQSQSKKSKSQLQQNNNKKTTNKLKPDDYEKVYDDGSYGSHDNSNERTD